MLMAGRKTQDKMFDKQISNQKWYSCWTEFSKKFICMYNIYLLPEATIYYASMDN